MRRELLNDPRLQLPVITGESAMRTELVKAQLERQHFRVEAKDEKEYLASLQIQCRVERLTSDRLARFEELFRRTTQFNTTGRKFSISELAALLQNPSAHLFSLDVADRFGDHGLTGGAVILDGEISGLVISCRVLGMGIEHTFLQRIMEEVPGALSGRIVETTRNFAVRNIYRDNGFVDLEPGVWSLPRRETKVPTTGCHSPRSILRRLKPQPFDHREVIPVPAHERPSLFDRGSGDQ